jgi:hypothetical protein
LHLHNFHGASGARGRTKISTREVDGSFTYYAPGVIGVNISAWEKHGKEAMKRARACVLGADSAGQRGEFHGGKWFYVGRRPPALKHKKNSPALDPFVDIAATIGVAQAKNRRMFGVLFADPDSAASPATEDAPGAGPTPRTPPSDRTIPDSKRARVVPALAQQLPLTAALLATATQLSVSRRLI